MGSRRGKRQNFNAESRNSQAKGLPQAELLERPPGKVTEGVSSPIDGGQSLR